MSEGDPKIVSRRGIEKPVDDKAYELGSRHVFGVYLNCSHVEMCGRNGQGQKGLDLKGFENDDLELPFGVQNKWKSPGKKLTTDEIDEEVRKLKKLDNPLKKYFIITTADHDFKLQEYADTKIKELANEGINTRIIIMGWSEQESIISNHPNLYHIYDETKSSFGAEQARIANETYLVALNSKKAISDLSLQMASLVRRTNEADAAVETTMIGLSGGVASILDDQITQLSEIRKTDPQRSIDELSVLLDKLGADANEKIRYRVKANIGLSYLDLGDATKGAALLREAHAHNPENSRANANLIVAASATDPPSTAVALSEDLLKIYPDDEDIWGYYLQVLRHQGVGIEVFDEIPTLLKTKRMVMIGMVIFARSLDNPIWTEVAIEGNNLFPDDNSLKGLAADAYLEKALTSEEFLGRRVISLDANSYLDAAKPLYASMWSLAQKRANGPTKEDVDRLSNFILALELNDDFDAALSLCQDNTELFEEHSKLADRACFVGMRRLEFRLVHAALQHVSEPNVADLHILQMAAANRDLDTLSTFSDGQINNIYEPDRMMARTLRDLAVIVSNEAADNELEIRTVFEDVQAGLRECVLCFDFAKEFGCSQLAEEIYEYTISTINDDHSFVERHMLYLRALERNDYSTVVKCLKSFVPTHHVTGELKDLVAAMANSVTIDQSTLNYLEALPDPIKNDPYFKHAAGVVASRRGDLIPAKKAFNEAFQTSKKTTSLLSLYQTLLRLDDKEAIARLAGHIDLEKLHGPLNELIQSARICFQYGREGDALKFAYKQLLKSPPDYQAIVQYSSMILFDTRNDAIQTPLSVLPDTEVSYIDNGGTVRKAFITDLTSPETGIYFSLSHEVSKSLLGKRVGETSEFDWLADNGTVEITEIKSGYVALMHNHMEDLEVRYPAERDIVKFTVQEDDLEPLFERMRAREETMLSAVAQYKDNSLPLCMVGKLVGLDTLQFANYLQTRGVKINSNLGLENVFEDECGVLSEINEVDLVVDDFTLWRLWQLGLLEATSQACKSLIAPQSALDKIRYHMQPLFTDSSDEDSLSVASVDGELVKHVCTPEDRAHAKDTLTRALNEIEQFVDIQPVTAPTQISSISSMSLQIAGNTALDPIFIAKNDKVLISEDFHYRALAKQEFATASVGILPLIHVLRQADVIDMNKRLKCLAGLSELSHGFLTVFTHDLWNAIFYDGEDELFLFPSISKELLGEAGYSNEHVNITSELFRNAFKKQTVSQHVVERSLGSLLQKIYDIHTPEAVRNIVVTLMRDGSIIVRKYIADWHSGHFITLPK